VAHARQEAGFCAAFLFGSLALPYFLLYAQVVVQVAHIIDVPLAFLQAYGHDGDFAGYGFAPQGHECIFKLEAALHQGLLANPLYNPLGKGLVRFVAGVYVARAGNKVEPGNFEGPAHVAGEDIDGGPVTIHHVVVVIVEEVSYGKVIRHMSLLVHRNHLFHI
jgi:hypothetical protein